jgi:hypothetical protein
VPDTYTTSDPRRFIALLGLSLSLHGLVLLWLAEHHAEHQTFAPPKPPQKRSVILQLQESHSSPREASALPADMPRDTEEPGTGTSTEPQADNAPAPLPVEPPLDSVATKSPPPGRLNLALPAVPATNSPVEPSASAIFDPTLTQRINRLRARSDPGRLARLSSLDQTDNQASFRGGRWQSFLRVGTLCFEVIEADPLEPLSNEQWYAVDCP